MRVNINRRTLCFLAALALASATLVLWRFADGALAAPVDVTPLPPVEETDGRAGACYSFYYDPPPERPFIRMAHQAGSRWDRFDFIWPNLEPANDQWNEDVTRAYDDVIHGLSAGGIENIVGILLWTPDWAAMNQLQGAEARSLDERPFGWYAPPLNNARLVQPTFTPSASSSPPQGLYLPWDHPDNHWGDFVYDVVSRYGDRVKYWEMWNEPEWTYFWTGTAVDYAQLLKVGYQASKAACPDCQVLFGGLHYWANPNFYRWVLGALGNDPGAPANNYYFDVMSVHFYSSVSNTYDKINEIRDGMATLGVVDHPIWLTETGAPVWNDASVDPDPVRYDFAARQSEAAAYVIQSYANALAADVERYFFFRTHDADMGEYFGLIRNDHSLRPSYVAYQVAITYLISPTFVTRDLTGAHRQVTLWGSPWGKVSVLWNESPHTGVYTLPAAMPTALQVDRWGMTRTVTPTHVLTGSDAFAAYTVTLPGATANLVSDPSHYFIGGDPLLMIESETHSAPPTSTVHSLPAMTTTLAFTVTWEGADSLSGDNGSGILGYDVQWRDSADGVWIDWYRMTPNTAGRFVGESGHTYDFRSRAIDRVGNREAWPHKPHARTTLDLTGTLSFSVTHFFADENVNHVWDPPIIDPRPGSTVIFEEITLTQVSVGLFDGVGRHVATSAVTQPWTFTTTVRHSEHPYTLRATSADGAYMRSWPMTFTWSLERAVYTRTYSALGLAPVNWIYLPLILRTPGT